MQPKIEILMATYNGSQYIEEQIESIREQSYENWILHISDDGSKDNTMDILKDLEKKDDRIKPLPDLGPQSGVVANFSRLLSQSSAKYVMFSDQDDIWLPQKIHKSFEKLEQLEKQYGKETPLLVHTDLVVVDSLNKEIHPSFWNYANLGSCKRMQFHQMLAQNVVTGCTILMNESLIKLAKPIPTEAIMHDWWLALVASAFGHIDIVDEPLMRYRQHSHNHTGAQKYGIINGLKRYCRTKTTVVREKKAEQAAKFLERYKNQLSPDQTETLQAYKKLCIGNFYQRRKVMFQHRFFKQGLLRNAHDLLLG